MDLPRIGVSACLLGERVRWDGRHKRDGWIAGDLRRVATLIPVCPEVEIGLGIPRPPIRLEDGAARGVRLVEPASGRDLTARMDRFADGRLATMEEAGLDGWILKARSHSCGLRRVEVHRSGDRAPVRRGRGLFAAALRERLPGLPVEEEARLSDPAVRKRFLARVLAHHRRRVAAGK